MESIVSRKKPPPGTLGVVEQRKLDKSSRIKAAAHAEFRERGFVGATMREIAARADVATGTLFLYAPDKSNLLLWILNEDLDILTDEAFAKIPPGATLLDQLVALFTPRYKYWGADPELAIYALQEVMLMRNVNNDPKSQIGHYHRRRASLISRIATIVETHQAQKTVRTDESATLIATLIMNIYLAAVRLWLREPKSTVKSGVGQLQSLLRLALIGVITPPVSP